MLFELSLIPIGRDSHVSRDIAEALKLIEQSGLPFQLTPSATCIEGEWNQVMPLIERCHRLLREKCPHLLTMIKVEDQEDSKDMIRRNIASVEEKVGHRLGESQMEQKVLQSSSA